MKEVETFFYSDGLKLNASYFYPDSYENDQESTKDSKKSIIMCSGFLGY